MLVLSGLQMVRYMGGLQFRDDISVGKADIMKLILADH
jgi:hypothetical protein